jgi:uncharacterized membrane-anchored protein
MISMVHELFNSSAASNICRQFLLKNRAAFEIWDAYAVLEQVCTMRTWSNSVALLDADQVYCC